MGTLQRRCLENKSQGTLVTMEEVREQTRKKIQEVRDKNNQYKEVKWDLQGNKNKGSEYGQKELVFFKRKIIFEELRRRESYQVGKLVHYLDL